MERPANSGRFTCDSGYSEIPNNYAGRNRSGPRLRRNCRRKDRTCANFAQVAPALAGADGVFFVPPVTVHPVTLIPHPKNLGGCYWTRGPNQIPGIRIQIAESAFWNDCAPHRDWWGGHLWVRNWISSPAGGRDTGRAAADSTWGTPRSATRTPRRRFSRSIAQCRFPRSCQSPLEKRLTHPCPVPGHRLAIHRWSACVRARGERRAGQLRPAIRPGRNDVCHSVSGVYLLPHDP